jgi:hypothetical protein
MEQLIAEDSAIVTPEELPVSPPCYIPLKEPLYHNMLIQAPDGTAICRAGPKKINWYLSRDLAEVISKVRDNLESRWRMRHREVMLTPLFRVHFGRSR